MALKNVSDKEWDLPVESDGRRYMDPDKAPSAPAPIVPPLLQAGTVGSTTSINPFVPGSGYATLAAKYRRTGLSTWNTFSASLVSPVTFVGLLPDTEYEIELWANGNASYASNRITFTTQPASSGGDPTGAVTPESVPWEANFILPPKDAAGYSIPTPSSDSRLIYLSPTGNDATAQVYSPASGPIGSNPRNPTGTILAFSTMEAAEAQRRQGYPDWLLIERGSVWTETTTPSPIGGRSATERAIITSYGPSTARPKWRTGVGGGLGGFGLGDDHVAVIGLDFEAHKRWPQGPDFVGWANTQSPKGFSGIVGLDGSGNPYELRNILIEDCRFAYFQQNSVQSNCADWDIDPHIHNFVLRRNVIEWYFGDDNLGHSLGFYTKNVSFLVEENIWDHCGWYDSGSSSQGGATIFSHNFYCPICYECIVRRNATLRSCSIGFKFTANPKANEDNSIPDNTNRVMARRILVDNNLIVEGEVGISIGGNKDYNNGEYFRWAQIHIRNNVLLHIGRTSPTGRSLSYGIGMEDYSGEAGGSTCYNNIAAHYASNDSFGITVAGAQDALDVAGNIIYNVSQLKTSSGRAIFRYEQLPYSPSPGVSVYDPPRVNVLQRDNTVIQLDSNGYVLGYNDLLGTTMTTTRYYTPRADLRISENVGTFKTFAQHQADVEPTAVFGIPNYVDPNRTMEATAVYLGVGTTFTDLLAAMKAASPSGRDFALTPEGINERVRAGFVVQA